MSPAEEFAELRALMSPAEREQSLQDILRITRNNIPSAISPETRAVARQYWRNQLSAGAVGEGIRGSQGSSGQFNVTVLDARNNPELFRQVADMSARLNARYGTNLPPPQVLISDDPQQGPIYNVAGDVVSISAASVRNGNAPAVIAHELGERISQEKFGDGVLHLEIHWRRALNLPVPSGLREAHRRHECREDADAIFLVGPDAVARAQAEIFNGAAQSIAEQRPGLARPGADALNFYNYHMHRDNHYPHPSDRLLMGQLMRENPELLAQLQRGQMEFDGTCRVIGPPDAVRAAGTTAQEPQQQATPRR
jgi:hypothetical protein